MTTEAARPILVVDDDVTACLLIDACLQATGLANPRIQLHDGEAAVATLRHLDEQGPAHLPALVLLDDRMPGRSGLDVLRWMAGEPTLSHVPVIILSGQAEVANVNTAYALGARCVLVKPVGFEALGAVIRDLGLPWQLA